MTPFEIFSFCQQCQQRSSGSLENFEKSGHYKYFCLLCNYFKNDLKFKTIAKIKKYIAICVKDTGHNFNPFLLHTTEYRNIVSDWKNKNSNRGLYYINVNESFKKIYKFCVDKDISTLEEYTKKWAVSHVSSGIINENIAYALDVHKLPLSKPEIMFINKKFLKHVKMIEERIARESKLREMLKDGIEDIKKKLIWRKEKI